MYFSEMHYHLLSLLWYILTEVLTGRDVKIEFFSMINNRFKFCESFLPGFTPDACWGAMHTTHLASTNLFKYRSHEHPQW